MSWMDKFFTERKKQKVIKAGLPQHIAIIMDGNGRWAKNKGMPRTFGHKAGAETLKRIAGFCESIGIKYLTVYAFSTENWKRPKEEVDFLMNLLEDYLKQVKAEIDKNNVKIKILGDISQLSTSIQNEIIEVEKKSMPKDGLNLNIAINYGARNEIVSAVKKIIEDTDKGLIDSSKIDEEAVAARLYTAGMPDPDLVIRPSGEKRVSNFLLWQLAYAELWFSNIYWPDFREIHLLKAIEEYQRRHRRFGGI